MNAIEVTGVSKSYGNYKLTDVTFGVPKGYITGLIGPNGAGKSTIIKMIMGMVKPENGSISIFGNVASPDNGKYREEIGYVSDENIYYDSLSMGRMKQIIAPFYSNWDEDAYTKYMTLFELPARKKIKDCSKGMKMKFSIAMALSHHPSLLIMDEPTAGLDPVFRRELLDLLSEYIMDEEKTVLFSTHLTTDLDRVADYITFLHGGRLVLTDTKDDVLERYLLVKGASNLLDSDLRSELVGVRETAVGFEGLARERNKAMELFGDHALYQQPTLEDIMYFTVKGGKQRA